MCVWWGVRQYIDGEAVLQIQSLQTIMQGQVASKGASYGPPVPVCPPSWQPSQCARPPSAAVQLLFHSEHPAPLQGTTIAHNVCQS